MIDRAENLLARIMPSGTEHHELVSVLTTHFGGSVHDTDVRVTLLPMRPPYALRLKYDRKLEPTGAFAEEALTEQDLRTVRAEMHRKYVESAGTGIGQNVLLVSGPMEGRWGYRDRFQIIPVPPEAPRPDFLMAAHPFLLEFTYNRSPDPAVSRRRWQREGYRISLVLSSLLRSITWYPPTAVGNLNHAWIQLPESGHSGNVAYCQIKYEHPSIRYYYSAWFDIALRCALGESCDGTVATRSSSAWTLIRSGL